MASIDAILDRILERNADGLRLQTGELPVVLTQTHPVPVQKSPSTAAQLLALARELASDPEDRTRIDNSDPCKFVYRTFDVSVSFDPAGPRIEITPCAGQSGADDSTPPSTPSGIELGPSGPIRSPAPAPKAADRIEAPAPPPAPAAPPAVWNDAPLVTRRTALIGAGVIGVLGIGGIVWCTRPVRVPNVVMADPSGRPVTFEQMREPRRLLMIVLVLPNDQISRFAIDSIKAVYEKASTRVSFAALYYGTTADAARVREELGAPFPFFGMKDAKNPFGLQEFFKKAGSAGLLGASVYGGTTILLDDRNRIVFKLEKDGVQKLPDKLAKLCE